MEFEAKNIFLNDVMPTYGGLGTVKPDGSVSYHVSLPRAAARQIHSFETFDLGDAILVRIITEPKMDRPYENPHYDVVLLQIPAKIAANGRERVAFYLWHDNQEVRDAATAREIAQQCGEKIQVATQPAKCGKGVLTFEL